MLIPAARGLIGWTQKELAKRCGITQSALALIESGKSHPRHETREAIINALKTAGVVFEEDGVRKPALFTRMITGEKWFRELQQDALHVLQNYEDREFLIYGGNNRISPPEVVENFREIRRLGTKMREMVCEGDLFLMGDEDEYRWIPKHLYQNYCTIIYADRVCLDYQERGGLLIIDGHYANAERNKFEMLWESGMPVKGKSNATIRYGV